MAGANTRLPPSGTFQYCSDPFNKQALGKPLPSLTLFTAVDEQVSLWCAAWQRTVVLKCPGFKEAFSYYSFKSEPHLLPNNASH
jgi:hypothetical protein